MANPDPPTNILLVDDHPESLLAMRAILEVLGQRIVTARSGREALHQVLEAEYATILLDVQMPDMDGFETAKLIRERAVSRATPIIFITGHELADVKVMKGYESGAIDYLFKPVVPEILRSKVAGFVEMARTRAALAAAVVELRAATAKYRTLVEELPAISYVAPCEDPGRMSYVSPQVEAQTGFPPGEWTGDARRWTERIHPEDRARVASDRDRSRRTGEKLACEYRLADRTGALRWFREESVVVRDEHGRPAFRQGLLLDLTDRKLAEALERERDAASAANRAKTWFLASVSHELRTPLNSIIGFANILARETDERRSGPEADYVERIRRNGHHLLALVNNILDVTRIEAGGVELTVAPAALDALVREVLGQLDLQASAKKINLVPDLPRDLDPLETDAGKLRQALLNLVGNAIKFTERGSVTVRVLATPGTRRPDRIEVEDTGIGIPREKQAMIFEPFAQADSGANRRYEGAGLGLTITRSLLDVMGYGLQMDSEPGRGSRFRIVLSARCGACDLADGLRRAGPVNPGAN